MTSTITNVLEMLSDGKWHMLDEIRQKTRMSGVQVSQVAKFLKEYDFVVVDEAKNRVKLNKETKKFLTQKTNA